METRRLGSRLLIGCLLLALLAGCAIGAQETATPEPSATPIVPTGTPGPTSCEEVEGNCLMVSFDGEHCTYHGPADLKSGPVTLIFLNESEARTGVHLLRHLGDETIQDAIDRIGEGPSPLPQPGWANPVNDWQVIGSGEIYTWEGSLKPAIHSVVCGAPRYGVWSGGGFTVEE